MNPNRCMPFVPTVTIGVAGLLVGRAIFLAILALDAGCYDPKSPNLPPCPSSATWPDPCFERAPADAGADAGKDASR